MADQVRRVVATLGGTVTIHHGTLFVGAVEDERRRGHEEPRVDDRGPCRFKGKRIDGGAWDWERSCTEAEIEGNEELREEFGDIVIDKGAYIDWSNFPITGPTAPVTDCRDTEDSRAIQAFSSVSDCFAWKRAPQLFKIALGRTCNEKMDSCCSQTQTSNWGLFVNAIAPGPADDWNASCDLSCPTDKLLIGDLIIQVNDISIQNGYQAMLDEFKLALEFRLVVARQPVRSSP